MIAKHQIFGVIVAVAGEDHATKGYDVKRCLRRYIVVAYNFSYRRLGIDFSLCFTCAACPGRSLVQSSSGFKPEIYHPVKV